MGFDGQDVGGIGVRGVLSEPERHHILFYR